LRQLAQNIFARGLGTLWATGGIHPDPEGEVSLYLRSLRLPARLRILVRALCWRAAETLQPRS
jgi:hypothetical protein